MWSFRNDRLLEPKDVNMLMSAFNVLIQRLYEYITRLAPSGRRYSIHSPLIY